MLTGVIDPAGSAAAQPSQGMVMLCEVPGESGVGSIDGGLERWYTKILSMIPPMLFGKFFHLDFVLSQVLRISLFKSCFMFHPRCSLVPVCMVFVSASELFAVRCFQTGRQYKD